MGFDITGASASVVIDHGAVGSDRDESMALADLCF